jgi:hypothetical protein
MSEAVVQRPAPEIAMDNDSSPKADKTPEASLDAPFTRFIDRIRSEMLNRVGLSDLLKPRALA